MAENVDEGKVLTKAEVTKFNACAFKTEMIAFFGSYGWDYGKWMHRQHI